MEQTDVATCPNCGSAVHGPFCSQCGQRQSPARPSVRGLLQDFTQHFLKVDGKLLRTLRALAVPGLLTVEYLAGRRERYERPFRLYLVLAALSFVAFRLTYADALSADVAQPFLEAEARGPKPVVEKAQTPATGDAHGDLGATDRVRHTTEFFRQKVPSLLRTLDYLMAPLLALALRLVHRKRGLGFAEHFVAALHLSAAGQLATLFATPLSLVSASAGQAVSALSWYLYIVLAQRRIFEFSLPAALWATVKVAALQAAAVGLLGMAGVAVLLLWLH